MGNIGFKHFKEFLKLIYFKNLNQVNKFLKIPFSKSEDTVDWGELEIFGPFSKLLKVVWNYQ